LIQVITEIIFFMEKNEFTQGSILNRNDLKNIKGGGSLPTPGTPSGEPIGPYKCCYPNTTNCSACVDCTPSCKCPTGTVLTAC